jgi:hypothetical protein
MSVTPAAMFWGFAAVVAGFMIYVAFQVLIFEYRRRRPAPPRGSAADATFGFSDSSAGDVASLDGGSGGDGGGGDGS